MALVKNEWGETKLTNGGDSVPKLEPKGRLNFWTLDKSIQKLRKTHKEHPEWFEISKPKSYKGNDIVYYLVSL